MNRWLSLVLEGWCYLLLVAAPWFFGGVEITYSIGLYLGISIMLLLAIAESWRSPRSYKFSGTLVLLALLFLFSCLQIIPLSKSTLAWLSPNTNQAYSQFLPQEQELPSDETAAEKSPLVGSTLSFYPGATRIRLLELLAIFALFAVFRYCLATPEVLTRMAWVLVSNCAALAVFAIFQKLNSPENQIYWRTEFTFQGALAFGPFINRNHFSSYVIFGLCMGMGLFLSLILRDNQPYRSQLNSGEQGYSGTGILVLWSNVLQHPTAVWLVIPLGVIAAAIVVSLSRSGMLAMAIGLGTLLLLLARFFPKRGLLSLSLVILVMGAGLLAWLGVKETINRFTQSDVQKDLRWVLFQSSFEIIRQYPLFGTGLGTFVHMEPRYRPTTSPQNASTMHAHNEYLEALVEGGIVRLTLTLLIIALVLRAGWKGVQLNREASWMPILLGAWAAFLALCVQSIVEFGIHVPAVALVTISVMGLLTGLADKHKSKAPQSKPNWMVLLVGSMIAATLSIAIALPAWNWYRSESLRLDAIDRVKKASNLREVERTLDMLGESIRLQPQFQRSRLDWIRASLQLLENRQRMQIEFLEFTDKAAFISLYLGLMPSTPGEAFSGWSSVSASRNWIKGRAFTLDERYGKSLFAEVQRQLIVTRNLCPLVAAPHLDIARMVASKNLDYSNFKRAEKKSLYLDRAKQLLPNNTDTWFQAGLQEWLDEQKVLAYASFRRSLELDPQNLLPILDIISNPNELLQTQNAAPPLDPKLVRENLLLPQPNVLITAAMRLFPKRDQLPLRKPWLDEAEKLLSADTVNKSPEKSHLEGLLQWGLNKPETGQHYLKDAIKRKPNELAWYVDLARLYVEMNKLEEAKAELRSALSRNAGLVEAQFLLTQIEEMQKATRPGS